MKNALPKWAIEAAMVQPDAVVAWVEGFMGNSWRTPIFLVTDSALFWVTRGFLRKKSHRIPRKNITSVTYAQAIKLDPWDTLYLRVAEGDPPYMAIRVNRKWRNETKLLYQELQRD